MEIKELYEIYGSLMIRKEILDGQINNVKQQISEILNKQPTPKKTEVKSVNQKGEVTAKKVVVEKKEE